MIIKTENDNLTSQNFTNAFILTLALFIAMFLMWNVAQAAETKEEIEKRDALINETISDLKTAIITRDFSKMKLYAPENNIYKLIEGCGAGETPTEDLSFEEITKIFLRESKGAQIFFNPEPEVEWANLKSMNIETEGWLGEYPFVTFIFGLDKDRMVWGGACYSPTPALKITKDNKLKPTYFRKPQLPRPGPRTFKDRSALMARIDEIVKFKQFDALEAYAVNKTLIFERHSKSTIDYYSGKYAILKGKQKPVREVIAFLKKNAQNAKEIKVSAIHGSYRQASGWGGKYPLVYFWIAEGKSGWEFAGVTYRKTSAQDELIERRIIQRQSK